MDYTDNSIVAPGRFSFVHYGRLSDAELITRLQEGHDDALTVLFDRLHRLVLSVAYKTLGDLGEAEDILQAVFLEVYEHCLKYDSSRGTVKIWLLQLAYNRSRTRRQYLQSRHFYDPAEAAAGEGHRRRFNPSGPGRPEQPEVTSLVRGALRTLTAQQRKTLELAYFRGLTLREIAGEMGESLGNVRHHYYRGLRQLRTLLSEGDKKPRLGNADGRIVDARA